MASDVLSSHLSILAVSTSTLALYIPHLNHLTLYSRTITVKPIPISAVIPRCWSALPRYYRYVCARPIITVTTAGKYFGLSPLPRTAVLYRALPCSCSQGTRGHMLYCRPKKQKMWAFSSICTPQNITLLWPTCNVGLLRMRTQRWCRWNNFSMFDCFKIALFCIIVLLHVFFCLDTCLCRRSSADFVCPALVSVGVALFVHTCHVFHYVNDWFTACLLDWLIEFTARVVIKQCIINSDRLIFHGVV